MQGSTATAEISSQIVKTATTWQPQHPKTLLLSRKYILDMSCFRTGRGAVGLFAGVNVTFIKRLLRQDITQYLQY